MGTYNIPRDTKGEGRLFYIFSTKALIYTVVGLVLGWILKWLLGFLGKLIPAIGGIMSITGIVIMIVFALLGFAIGTFKVPAIEKFDITKKAAGLNIDKVLWGSIKFNFKKSKYYVYDTKELVREEIIKDEKERREIEEKEEKLRNENMVKNSQNRRGYIQR